MMPANQDRLLAAVAAAIRAASATGRTYDVQAFVRALAEHGYDIVLADGVDAAAPEDPEPPESTP